MSKFIAKELNENEINGGEKWEYGQSPSVEAFNAPVEAILHAQAKLEEHQKDFEQIYAILGDTVTDKITVSQAYQSRETANGNQDIIDGQYTPINLIEGDTVNSKNLLDITKANWDTEIVTVDGNGFIVKAGTFYVSSNVNGTAWVQKLCPNLRAGDIVRLSFRSNTQKQFVYWGDGIKEINAPITVTQEMLNQGSQICFYGNADENPTYFYDLQIEKGETATSYVPYFEGLKHAHFKAIKSKGRNLFNPETIMIGKNWLNQGSPARSTSGLVKIEDAYISYSIKVKKFPKNADRYEVNFYPENDYASVFGSTGWKDTTDVYTFKARTWNTTTKYISVTFAAPDGYAFTKSDFDDIEVYLVKGETIENEEPYTENIFELPETFELKKWDSFNPQTGELIRQTGIVTRDTAFTEEEIASYGEAVLTADGKTLAYKLATQTFTKLDNIPKSYKAYKGGSESVIQGETDNSEYGAMPTITQEYYTQKGS